MVENKALEVASIDIENDVYFQSVSMLVNMKLQSLMIRCPVCGRNGLTMTKWIKGRKTKPLYVFHRSNNGGLNDCYLSDKADKEIRRKIELSATDLRQLLGKTNVYVLISGGLDSLCTIIYLLEVAGNSGSNITALHIDTTAGFPEVTEYVKEICESINVQLEIVRPKRDYYQLAKRWGIPGFNARWCCKELKVKPVQEYLSRVPEPKIVVDGIRSAESSLRSTYLPVWYHPAFQCLSVSPILGWSNEQVKSYFEASGLPEGPAKQMGCSAECWCGAYKARSDFEKLLEVHPEIFDKLVEVEEAQQGRYTFIYENGHQVTLESLKVRSSGK